MYENQPLEWSGPRWSAYEAKTEFGEYVVFKTALGVSCSFLMGSESVVVYYAESGGVDDAKQAAETRWQERVKRCLIN